MAKKSTPIVTSKNPPRDKWIVAIEERRCKQLRNENCVQVTTPVTDATDSFVIV